MANSSYNRATRSLFWCLFHTLGSTREINTKNIRLSIRHSSTFIISFLIRCMNTWQWKYDLNTVTPRLTRSVYVLLTYATIDYTKRYDCDYGCEVGMWKMISNSFDIEVYSGIIQAWWRHQMGTFSVSLAICAGNSPVTGEFPTQRPVSVLLIYATIDYTKRYDCDCGCELGMWKMISTINCTIIMKTKSRFSRNVYAICGRIWCNKHLRHTTTGKYDNNG